MVKDGAFVNPLKLVSPRAAPVEPAERVAFEAVRDQGLSLLGMPSAAPVLTTAVLTVSAPVAVSGGVAP
jgi:hypothetical protein